MEQGDSPPITEAAQIAGRFEEGRVLFSQATLRAQSHLCSIINFPRILSKTMPHGRQHYEQECVDMILECLGDPKMSEIFLDPNAMARPENYKKAAVHATQAAFESVTALVDTASLVFAHSVFDATLSDYCRVCALRAPLRFVDLLGDRKVSLIDSQRQSPYAILWGVVESYLAQIGRESLIKKANVLHQLTKPDSSFFATGPVDFTYSTTRLETIDQLRHQAVHGLEFTRQIHDLGEHMVYLLRAVFYFVRILHFRFGLQIDLRFIPAPGG